MLSGPASYVGILGTPREGNQDPGLSKEKGMKAAWGLGCEHEVLWTPLFNRELTLC